LSPTGGLIVPLDKQAILLILYVGMITCLCVNMVLMPGDFVTFLAKKNDKNLLLILIIINNNVNKRFLSVYRRKEV